MEILEAVSSLSLKNILLATDLSPASEKALLYARALAREQGSRVYTMHVSAPDDYQLLCPEAFADTFNHLDDGLSGSGILRSLLRGLPREVPLHGQTTFEIIEDVAFRYEIDLVIVGTHGRTGLQKMLFGSVAEELFRDIFCPVLTVGSHAKDPGGSLRINRVLLATDCSPTSLAPAYAASVCEQFGAELTALVVAEDNPIHQFNTRQGIREQVVSLAPQLASLHPRPFFILENGEPAQKILQVATAVDPDLIVLGAHHRRDVRSTAHFPWATASHVIAASPCPVLTVRDVQTDIAEKASALKTSIFVGR